MVGKIHCYSSDIEGSCVPVRWEHKFASVDVQQTELNIRPINFLLGQEVY